MFFFFFKCRTWAGVREVKHEIGLANDQVPTTRCGVKKMNDEVVDPNNWVEKANNGVTHPISSGGE